MQMKQESRRGHGVSLSRGRKLTVEGAQSLPKTAIGRVTCSTTLLVLAPVGPAPAVCP